MQITTSRAKTWRFRQSGLIEPFSSAALCADKLLGIQAQIFTAASISIALRTSLGSHAELEEKFAGERAFVKTWGQRNTVHLYPSHAVPRMATALGEEPAWSRRQFLKLGGSGEDYEALVTAAIAFLAEKGRCTREEMSDFLTRTDPRYPGLGSWGGLLVDMGKRGQLCLGGYEREAGAQLLYAPAHWSPELSPPYPDDFDQANAGLLLDYFRHYGPATLPDFCHWRGVPQAQARNWMARVRDRLAVLEVEGREMYLPTDEWEQFMAWDMPEGDLPPTLLYRFDPMVLAHRDKDWLVRDKDYKKVWRKAAHVEGVAVKNGNIVGVWKFQRKSSSLRFLVHHFRKTDQVGKRALGKRLGRVAEYLGYRDWDWVEEEF